MSLNLNHPYTTADVAALLASKDDSANRQLRVSSAGVAELSDQVGNRNISGLAFRLETWSAGGGHVGPVAAADPAWVARIEKVLRANWPTASDSYIEFY